MYSVWLGNQLFVMVSDPQIVKVSSSHIEVGVQTLTLCAQDLMVTNGAIFSSRKEMFLKSKKIFVGRGITATVRFLTYVVRSVTHFTLRLALQ